MIEVLISVLFLAILAYGGWYIHRSNKKLAALEESDAEHHRCDLQRARDEFDKCSTCLHRAQMVKDEAERQAWRRGLNQEPLE